LSFNCNRRDQRCRTKNQSKIRKIGTSDVAERNVGFAGYGAQNIDHKLRCTGAECDNG
jgi:hypothetical protein